MIRVQFPAGCGARSSLFKKLGRKRLEVTRAVVLPVLFVYFLPAGRAIAACSEQGEPADGQASAQIHLGRGYDHLEKEQYQPAADEFKAALALDPRLIRARYQLEVCNFALGRRTEARSPSNALIHKINVFRIAHHLRPLTGSGSLHRTASSYAHRMMRRDYFAHARRITASRRLFRTVGEALEMHGGGRVRASLAVANWKRSPPHRRLLLSPAFRWIGAGFASGTFRGHRATIWVVQVGAR